MFHNLQKQMPNLEGSDFSFFLERAFMEVNPHTKFQKNWHIDVIAQHLCMVTEGKIKRLIINVPPRSLKSFCINVAWPAWILGNDPSARIISASYSQHLSNKHSLDCRHLINSPMFGSLFPDLKLTKDQNAKAKFITTARGYRFSTSVTGSTTGEGGNILIVDDPHNAAHIHSPIKRKAVHTWFQQSFSSRLDDKKEGAIVVVMQRLHQDDLTGFLLQEDNNGWFNLNIPAISEHELKYCESSKSYLFHSGQILHKDREGVEEIDRAKQELGNFAFAAQYLQNPVASGGNMLHKNWLNYYESLPEAGNIILSWDTAIKAGSDHSYSVCSCWLQHDNRHYLLEVIRNRYEYPELRKKMIELARKYRPLAILIEDKASGQSLLQDLKREINFALIGIKPKADKITRFAATTPIFEAGRVFLPKKAEWLDAYVNELTSFPSCSHDDQADSTSQYLNYYSKNQRRKAKSRQLYII